MHGGSPDESSRCGGPILDDGSTCAVNVAMLLEMAAEGMGDRVAFGPRAGGLTYAELLDRAKRTATVVRQSGAERVGLLDQNSEAVPQLLFASAIAGVPFAPVNYRLADERLKAVAGRLAPALVVAEEGAARPRRRRRRAHRGASPGAARPRREPPSRAPMPTPTREQVAVWLFTSGTTGEPKAALLRHRHLVSYVLSTVDFMSSGEDEAALVSVPPYHIAGIAAILTGDVRRKADRLPAPVRRRRVGPPGRGRGGDPRDGRADDARPHPRRDRSSAGDRLPDTGPPVVRRGADACPRHRAGDGPAPARGVRQRLRPHRDELDDRRARAGGPSAGRTAARTRRCAPGSGRSAGPSRRWSWRSAARMARRCRSGRRARSSSGASRSPVSTSVASALTEDGLVPDQ